MTIRSKIPTDTGTVRHAQTDNVLCKGQMITSQRLLSPESSQDGRSFASLQTNPREPILNPSTFQY